MTLAVGDWAWGAMKIHEIAAPSESEMPNDSNDRTEISNEFK